MKERQKAELEEKLRLAEEKHHREILAQQARE